MNATSEDGFDPVKDPAKNQLILISKNSLSKVLSHLNFIMCKNYELIIQGLAATLSRMILLSLSTWKQITNLGPFFVPQRNSKSVNNTNLLKLQVMEQGGKGHEEKDVDTNTTSQVPQWLYKVTGPRKQTKN